MSEDRPLNAQQLKQIQDNANLQLGKIVEQLQLRKWAVEQAFSLAGSINNVELEQQHRLKASTYQITNPMKLAEAIYDFVVQPAALRVTAG